MTSSLESLVMQFDSRKPPPVELWKPDRISTIDININRQGEWFYRGSKIERTRMVALFSTILLFTDNTGNRFTADNDHHLWISYPDTGEPLPMVIVRRNLPALLCRAVYYQLAELMTEKDSVPGVWSEGVFFKLDG